MTSASPAFSHQRARRAGIAAFVGTTIEWYDFYVYATAAALVFGQLFFPGTDRLTGIAAAFATYAIGFFARPLGAVVFGHIGDRYGRRPSLVATLLLMGISTVLVGLLPTYTSIGVWAPVLLVILRFVQGLAVGGEWGGAVLMSVEHAPEKYKTFYGGFPQLGNPAGALLASGIFWILSLGGNTALVDGAWRIPFLLSAALIVLGFWLRFRVEESPVFEGQVESPVEGRTRSLPLVHALRTNWRPILIGIGLLPVSTGGYHIATTFATSYGTGPEIGISESDLLVAMTIASLVELLVALPTAWLGDVWGRKRVMITGLIGAAVLVSPAFLVMSPANVGLVILFVVLLRMLMTATYAPVATIIAQMFRPDGRYTSISIAYGTAAAIWGGLSPIVATGLYAATGTVWSVIAMFVAMVVVSMICIIIAPQLRDETENEHVDESTTEKTGDRA